MAHRLLIIIIFLSSIHISLSKKYVVPVDFKSISECINFSQSDDTIFVSEGIYKENLVIMKPLTIIGYNDNKTIIDGDYKNHSIFINSENVILKNLSIINSKVDSAGILLYYSNNCKIDSCKISDNTIGISLICSMQCFITDNNISNNTKGICFNSVDFTEQESWANSENLVSNNLLEKNITGISFEHDVYYHHSQNLIKNNIIRNNELGMSMIMSDHNVIRNNTYENNSGHAIEISTCEGGGGYNLFYQNNFIDNNSTHQSDTMQVLNGCWARNLWHNNGNGNYWSDYKGSDKDGNGIGDEIYLISSFGDFFLADSFPTIKINTGVEIDRSEYHQEKNKILISPNPASAYIEINVGPQRAAPDEVRIFDQLGVSVNCGIATPPAPSLEGESIRIDISQLAPGVYFVRIGDVVGKFVKW